MDHNEGEDFVQDLLDSKELSSLFDQSAKLNRESLFRPVLETDDPTNVRRKVDTNLLMRYFMTRLGFFMNWLGSEHSDIMKIFDEKAVLDIFDLYCAGGFEKENSVLQHLIKDLEGTLHWHIPEAPDEYLKSLCDIYEPITSEEEMDKIFLSILDYKLRNNGLCPKAFSEFILRQCFYEDSAIMRNKEKYEQATYRALADFAKAQDTADSYRIIREIIIGIDSLEQEHSEKDERRIQTIISEKRIQVIINDIKELVRRGWVFSPRLVEKMRTLLEQKKLRQRKRKNLINILKQAKCSEKKYNNSPIVIFYKDERKDSGETDQNLIKLDINNVKQLIWGDVRQKLDAINTVFHEVKHARQHREYGNPNTYDRFVQLKMYLISTSGKIDRDQTYRRSDLREREACLWGAIKTLEFIKKNRLEIDIDIIEEIIKDIRIENTKIKGFYSKDFPVVVNTENGYKERSLNEVFEEYIKEHCEELSRKRLDEEWGEEWIEEFILPGAVYKYKEDPEKEVEIEDFLPGIHELNDNPILRLEYDDRGEKRSFKDFLRNVISIMCFNKFAFSDKKYGFIIDKYFVKMIMDIANLEYMTLENLPEILESLSSEELQYDGKNPDNQNVFYQNIVKDITRLYVGRLMQEAIERMDELPKDYLLRMQAFCENYKNFWKEPIEKRKRRDFLIGMHQKGEDGIRNSQRVKEFEEKAKERLEKLNSEMPAGPQGTPSGSTRPDGGFGIGD